MTTLWPWLTLALLGAYHGLNPAMGWLFAVALGLQEQRRAAVIRAFAPIALGHASAIALAVALVAAMQALVAPDVLRIVCRSVLLAFGLWKLMAPAAHPRWIGMRVGFRDLTAWSFLMATAHGAGLMLIPLVLRLSLGSTPVAHAQHTHAEHVAAVSTVVPGAGFLAIGIHTLAMFLVMSGIAIVVYEKLGLALLRQAWFNLDRMWAAALVGAGLLTFVI